jgi:hypothetical protein
MLCAEDQQVVYVVDYEVTAGALKLYIPGSVVAEV